MQTNAVLTSDHYASRIEARQPHTSAALWATLVTNPARWYAHGIAIHMNVFPSASGVLPKSILRVEVGWLHVDSPIRQHVGPSSFSSPALGHDGTNSPSFAALARSDGRRAATIHRRGIMYRAPGFSQPPLSLVEYPLAHPVRSALDNGPAIPASVASVKGATVALLHPPAARKHTDAVASSMKV